MCLLKVYYASLKLLQWNLTENAFQVSWTCTSINYYTGAQGLLPFIDAHAANFLTSMVETPKNNGLIIWQYLVYFVYFIPERKIRRNNSICLLNLSYKQKVTSVGRVFKHSSRYTLQEWWKSIEIHLNWLYGFKICYGKVGWVAFLSLEN